MAPPLTGVNGRKAGSTGFSGYSDALKHSDIVWSVDTLSEFLAAPNKKVPGTRMVINVTSPQDRADIVAYLSGLK
jgi:cytochrome c